MIVQSAAANQPHFVIEQADHARMAGQLASAFGNETFAQPVPRDLLIYVAAHHDEGWQAIDALCEQSPTTGLPHHLTQTPLAYLLQTSKGSPDFNEAHHPFCGLLSSMHTYGLFNGRYGLSDFIFIDQRFQENLKKFQEGDSPENDLENRKSRIRSGIRMKYNGDVSAMSKAKKQSNLRLIMIIMVLGLACYILMSSNKIITLIEAFSK